MCTLFLFRIFLLYVIRSLITKRQSPHIQYTEASGQISRLKERIDILERTCSGLSKDNEELSKKFESIEAALKEIKESSAKAIVSIFDSFQKCKQS